MGRCLFISIISIISVLWGSCGGGAARRIQTERAARLMPPTAFEVREVYKGPQRTARVRVYADHEHRAQSIKWRKHFARQIEMANAFMVPAFGVKLEVVEIKEWTRQSLPTDLEAILTELEGIDSGADVDWVIGLVSALDAVSSSVHTLGVARPLGRHLLLRGYNDVAERKAYSAAFDELTEAERETLHDARRRHKQTMVLLHELAHTVGAIHTRTEQWIMNVQYSNDVIGFSPQNEALIRTMLGSWLASPGARDDVAIRRALRQYLEKNAWEGWIEGDKQFLLDFVAQADAPEGPDADVPAAARRAYIRARQVMRGGDLAAAQTEIDALVKAHPDNAPIRLLACEVALARAVGSEGGVGDEARAPCERYSELAPADPAAEFLLAEALAVTGDRVGARAALDRARPKLDGLADDARAEGWARLLALYRRLGSVTWVEQVVAAAPPVPGRDEALAWAADARRRYALPQDAAKFQITPDKEPEYIGAVSDMILLIQSQKLAEAKQLGRKTLRAFPDAPGVRAMLCDAHVRERAFGAARTQCRRALAGYDGAPWPHYLLGIVELHFKRNAVGIRHLERAIEVDPSLGQPYRALCQAYKRVRKRAELEALDQAHRALFGTPLSC